MWAASSSALRRGVFALRRNTDRSASDSNFNSKSNSDFNSNECGLSGRLLLTGCRN